MVTWHCMTQVTGPVSWSPSCVGTKNRVTMSQFFGPTGRVTETMTQVTGPVSWSPSCVGTKNRVTMLRFFVPTRDWDYDTGRVTETMTQVTWWRPWHRSFDGDHDTGPFIWQRPWGLRPILPTITNTNTWFSSLRCDSPSYSVSTWMMHTMTITPPTWLSPCDSSSGSVCTLCTLRWWPLDPRTPRPVSRQCDSSSKYFSCCCKLTIFGPQYLILQWRPSGRDISVPTLHFPLEKDMVEQSHTTP